MIGALVIVFREVLEAALVIGVVAAAVKGLPRRGRYVTAGVALGVAGAAAVAAGIDVLSRLAHGTGHALFERYAAAARGDRVTVLVSHRFSTVRMADSIVVLDGARVVEAGTHAELMALGGRYATLFDLQAAGLEARPEAILGIFFEMLALRQRGDGAAEHGGVASEQRHHLLEHVLALLRGEGEHHLLRRQVDAGGAGVRRPVLPDGVADQRADRGGAAPQRLGPLPGGGERQHQLPVGRLPRVVEGHSFPGRLHRSGRGAGAPVRLTPMEYRLLTYFVAHAGRVVTHRQILREVWGPGHADGSGVAMERLCIEAEPPEPTADILNGIIKGLSVDHG